mgnify:CR=1 FL=1
MKLGDFKDYAFTAASGDNTVNHITVNFESVTSMEANHPYIIRVENAIEEFTAQNVTIAPAQHITVYGYTNPVVIEYRKFVGTYTANFDFYHAAMINDWVYPPLFLSGNKFWYASENTQPMKAFRAYFTFKYHYAPDMDTAETRVDLNFNDGEATAISSVPTLAADGPYYYLNGQAVERPAKGLYIHNGKKVILK